MRTGDDIKKSPCQNRSSWHDLTWSFMTVCDQGREWAQNDRKIETAQACTDDGVVLGRSWLMGMTVEDLGDPNHGLGCWWIGWILNPGRLRQKMDKHQWWVLRNCIAWDYQHGWELSVFFFFFWIMFAVKGLIWTTPQHLGFKHIFFSINTWCQAHMNTYSILTINQTKI